MKGLMMVDFAYICGMASDEGPGQDGYNIDHEVHDPDGFCGVGFSNLRRGAGGSAAPFRSYDRAGKSRHDWQPDHGVTCKRCGEKELKWRETSDGWRLFSKEHNEKLQHFCSKPASPDEFDVC